jgi:hypothetical protein
MIIERFFGKGRSGQSDSPGEPGSPAQTPVEAQQQPRAQDRSERASKRAPNPPGGDRGARQSELKETTASRVRPGAPVTGGGATTTIPTAAPPAEPTYEEIAARAYDVWVAHGRADGRDHENWIEAERQLRTERARV